jgi:demethylmenaquinone methyltransferase/2-methoxy-6-polyprenyl-1,4-benzoquinol methylase
LTLRSTLATPEGKRRYARRLFATIADRYDFITRLLSCGQDRRWKARLIALAAITPRDRVLDLACGTGDLTFAAGERARAVVGLDLTPRMLEHAALREASLTRLALRTPLRSADLVRSAGCAKATFVCGDMLALPFPSASFEVVTTGYGLRNVADLRAALSEIHRVLTPGGRVLSLDFNRPENALIRAAYLSYLTVVGSTLGFVLHNDADTYRYIPESIRLYPGARGVAARMTETGFSEVRVEPLLGGLMAIHEARKV